MSRQPDVSFVIPCLNEAKTIARCVARAAEAAATLEREHGLTSEIIVSDNGSDDGSQTLAAEAGARVATAPERGYGAALSHGMRAAKGDYLVMADADLSYDFMEAPPMVTALVEGADLCMGSRFDGEIKPGAMPWKNRYIGNPALSGALRFLFRTKVRDAHCGLRALTRASFDRMRLTSTGMEFASEMVIKAALLGERIVERPVTLHPDERGRPPHLRPWRDGWRHLRFMFMLSPAWLFFAPAAFFGIIAIVMLTALMLGVEQTMVSIGPLRFGDHWMAAASAALILAYQLAFFGVAAFIHSVREGWRRTPRAMRFARRAARLEYWLITGGVSAGVGFAVVASIAARWIGSDFGALDAMREQIAGFTLIVLGVNIAFGGFLLSIIAGAKARFQHDKIEYRDGTAD